MTINERLAAILERHRQYVDRFWSKVDKSAGVNACWPWTGLSIRGYGQISFGRKGYRAPRVAWTIANGEIPEGLHALHHCDNPACCNPAHIWCGTNYENVLDRDRKGRASRGERHFNAKHTDEFVRYAVSLANQLGTCASAARQLNICPRMLRQWTSGETRATATAGTALESRPAQEKP